MLRSLTRDSRTKSDFAVNVLFSIINQKCYTYRNVHNPIDLVYEKLTCIYLFIYLFLFYFFIFLFFFAEGGGVCLIALTNLMLISMADPKS